MSTRKRKSSFVADPLFKFRYAEELLCEHQDAHWQILDQYHAKETSAVDQGSLHFRSAIAVERRLAKNAERARDELIPHLSKELEAQRKELEAQRKELEARHKELDARSEELKARSEKLQALRKWSA